MKIAWIGVCCFVLTACLNTTDKEKARNATSQQPPEDPNSYTTIQWIDSTKDLGTITEGQKLEVAFRFKNTGTKPLVIRSVHASCGCTTPSAPARPFAPGEESEIKATFDSRGREGRNNKTIYVSANTFGTQNHELTFTVDVAKAKQ